MLQMDGPLFGSEKVSWDEMPGAYAFIDIDRDSSTGYQTDGLGAEFMVFIAGMKGSVPYSYLYTYDRGHRSDIERSQADFNGWDLVSSVHAASSGSSVEVSVPASVLLRDGAGCAITFRTINHRGEGDTAAVHIGPGMGAALMTQIPLVTDTAPPGERPVMILRLEGVEGTTTVTSVDLRAPGLEDLTIDPLPVTVEAGQAVECLVTARVPAFAGNEPLTVEVAGASAVDSPGSVITLAGSCARFYPEGEGLDDLSAPRADGVLLEWDGIPMTEDPAGDTANPNIDLTGHAAQRSGDGLAILCQVRGRALGGSEVSSRFQSTSLFPDGGAAATSSDTETVAIGPSPPNLPPSEGMDIVYAFIDTDMDKATGYRAANGVKGIGADYVVETQGRGGALSDIRVREYIGSGTSWEWGPGGEAQGEAVGPYLEVTALPAGAASLDGGPVREGILTRDWVGSQDTSGEACEIPAEDGWGVDEDDSDGTRHSKANTNQGFGLVAKPNPGADFTGMDGEYENTPWSGTNYDFYDASETGVGYDLRVFAFCDYSATSQLDLMYVGVEI
jgi:hypothetical protein